MKNKKVIVALAACLILFTVLLFGQAEQKRARDLGIKSGVLQTGNNNAITDVAGVRVGHFTLSEPGRYNTGVTAILPHGDNLFQHKVPAAIAVGNGFGKLVGLSQVNELGEIETPVLLTGTLNVFKVADGLIEYMLSLENMENVYSINPVVGETNDGYLNDIRSRPLGYEAVRKAIESASAGPVDGGSIGAGRGTICFGFKGGIGTSSRKLPKELGGWTVGVLVQTNFGGDLRIGGIPVGQSLGTSPYQKMLAGPEDGSCMIVIASDAPLEHRNLMRLAKRSFLGLARTGGFASNGSGDYAIAFSTFLENQIHTSDAPPRATERIVLANQNMSPLFLAVVEATEEAIIDSLFLAERVQGFRGDIGKLPVERVLELIRQK